jgi:hypothetical protein
MYTKACIYAVYLELTKKWMNQHYELLEIEEGFREWAAPTLFLRHRTDPDDTLIPVPLFFSALIPIYVTVNPDHSFTVKEVKSNG